MSKELSENCLSKEDGVCRLPVGSCHQCCDIPFVSPTPECFDGKEISNITYDEPGQFPTLSRNLLDEAGLWEDKKDLSEKKVFLGERKIDLSENKKTISNDKSK